MRRRLPKKSHFWLFIFLSVFLTAQVSWWIVLHQRASGQYADLQEELWHQQVTTAYHWANLNFSGDGDTLKVWLENSFPDLRVTGTYLIGVRPEARARVDHETRRNFRMFAWEGGFFFLVLVFGMIYIYTTFRREVQIERRQSDFLSAISHELRTPITAMRLYIETLLTRELKPERTREMYQSLEQNVTRLQKLIDRLLRAREIQMDKEARGNIPLNLSEATPVVLKEICEQLGDLHSCEIIEDIDVGCTALFDEEDWKLVVGNLVENAFKYSPDRQPVTLSLKRAGRVNVLKVVDRGIGFRRGERQKLFQRFYRVGNEDTRKTRGSGLGLYLVKEILKAHGGTIRASSSGEGKGAAFIVSLPYRKENQRGRR